MSSLLVTVAFLTSADLGSEVRSVFSAKCAGCHDAAKIKKPKGGIGFILDIKKVAADREIVVPGDLKRSNLYLLTESSNMPPNDSPTGPLSAAQKTLIKTWIEAGCPPPMPAPVPPVETIKEPAEKPVKEASAPTTAPVQEDAPVQPQQVTGPSFLGRAVSFAGNFHLLVLHFPIALVMIAATAEGLAWCLMRTATPERHIMGTLTYLLVGTLVVMATVAAVPTVALGWLHANSGFGAGQPDNLFWHSWLGTGVLVLLGGTAWLCWGDAAAGTRRVVTTGAILGSALLMGLVGHFGGMMVHGRAFLNW